MRQCLTIGYEHLGGLLDGGIRTWTDAGLATSSIPLLDLDAVVGTVIDVRQHDEFAAGHLPGATNIELGSIGDGVPPDGPVTVMCGHGERAMTGASVLEAKGARDLHVLIGGPDDWSKATGETLEFE